MKSLLVAGVAAALLTGGAAAEPASTSAKKCPRGKVAVKVLGKRSCRPVAAALPRPRKGDELVPVLQHGLDPTWGETRGGPPTLDQLLGAETKSALDAALQRSLGRLSAAGRRHLSSALAGAAAKCRSDRVLPVTSETYKEDLGGGNQLDVQVRTGPEGAAVTIGATVQQGGGRAVRISIDLGLCSGEALHVDQCPTAQGVVEGTDNYGGTITTQELEDGDVVSTQVVKVTVETKLRGQVETDAKLSELRIDRTESYDVAVTHGRWLGVGQKSKATRKATISMPGGTYSSTSSSLDLQQSFSGVLSFLVNESAARTAAIADLERSSNQAWAGFVDEALKAYRDREKAWQNAPYPCARLEFSPKSNTLKLSLGDEGRASGTIEATRGGSPQGIWKVVARKNLGVRLGNADRATLPFSYRADAHGAVSVTFRVTSKAGVAEGTWAQGTEDPLPKRFSGTFSGKIGGSGAGSSGGQSFTGSITFVQRAQSLRPGYAQYSVERVDFTTTVALTLPNGCSGTDTKAVTLRNEDPRASALYLARRVTPGKGRGYLIVTFHQQPQPENLTVNCPDNSFVTPWTPAATISTVLGGDYYAAGTRLRGTNSAQGVGPYTWDLRGSS